MFDFIGLFFATCFLFAIAGLAAAILALLTWLATSRVSARRKWLVLFAIFIPLVSTAYLWICVAVLPGESLFGDIDEPLPNGYVLRALGKMPDFAYISNTNKLWTPTGLTQCIGKLAVTGPFVVGQYSHPGDTFQAQSSEPFFLFDTRISRTEEFPTEEALAQRLDGKVTLVGAVLFRSPLGANRRRINNTIMFGPPLLLLSILLSLILRSHARINA